MSFSTVRRVCSRIFGVGQSRVKIIDLEKASKALSADDVRLLVKENAVVILPIHSPSRAPARFKQSRLRAGRRRGKGSKKGTSISEKALWMRKIRSQRKLLFSVKKSLTQGTFRKVYNMVKGNAFKSKHALLTYLRENKLIITGDAQK